MSLAVPAVIRALRPAQWTKNAVVLAPLIFAFGDRTQHAPTKLLLVAAAATAVFCIVSSAVYLLNDVRDVAQDRLHPAKRLRPIAAGELSISTALVLSVLFAAAGLVSAWLLGPGLLEVVCGYLALQAIYTLGLKRVALVDLFVIASGFVLRALGGAVAVGVTISSWLLLCTFLLALFLALCKRRHELVVVSDAGGETRASLRQYNEKLLDQLISMTAAATVVCYAIYTQWPETVHKFGTARMGFTIPFVMFGLFRYLDNVYRKDKGGRPEQILLTDRVLLLDLALYLVTVLLIFFGSWLTDWPK